MAPVHIPILAFLLGLFLIAWLGAMIGRPLVRMRPRPSHLLLGATTALAFYSLAMTVLGMFGGLGRASHLTIGAFLVVGAWYINHMMRWDGRQRPRLDWRHWAPPDLPSKILLWLLVVFQVVMFINALAPFINTDTETYHYLFVREYLESGRITIFPENAYSYYPLGLEMMVATAFGRAAERGPEAANLCFWFMQLLLMGWLLDFCARRKRVRVGYLLAAAVSGLFFWPVIAYSGDVDGGVALFALAGALSYFEWLERRGKPIEEKRPPKRKHLVRFWRWQQAGFTQLILAGFFLGTACAAKYSALPMAGLILLHLLWLLIVDGRNRRITWPAFLGLIIFLLIPMIPWYGRNLLVAGNPLFPFLRGLLGGPEPAFADDVSTWAGWGIPVAALNYLLYPFKLALFYKQPEPFSWVRAPYMYMSWLFWFAPLASVLLFHRRLERIVVIWCFLFFSFVFFVMNLQTRYFLPFTILALWLVCEWLETLVSVTPASELSTGQPVDTRKKPAWGKWVIFLIVLIPFLTQLDLVRNHFAQRSPYLTGQLTREEYEESVWPSAMVFDRANEIATEDSQICIFSLRTYRLSAPHTLPPEDAFDADLSPDQMLDRLEERQVGYLLLESRMRRAGVLFDWCLEHGSDDEEVTIFDEGAMLRAVGELGVSRNLGRELLRHQGGQRSLKDNVSWEWRINLERFRRPQVRGILRFLASLQTLDEEGRVGLVSTTDEWELYEMVGE